MNQLSKPLFQSKENHLEKLKEIVYYIKLGNDALKNLSNRHIAILLIGASGSGKSVTCNFLVGCKMINDIYVHDVYDKDLDRTFEKRKKVISAEKSVFAIGNNESSETSVIQVFEMSPQNIYLVCDCPGFFDTRSVEIEIAHSVCLENFLQKCQSVIPIVLIPYTTINQPRGDQLNKQLQIIIESLTNQQDEDFNKFLFLYTHAAKDVSIEDIQQCLENLIVDKSLSDNNQNMDRNENQINNKKQKRLLNILLKQIDQYQDILILDPIEKNREVYLDLIKRQQPFQNPKEEFSIGLSQNAFNSMSLHIEKVKIQINELLIQNNYQAIIEVILTLKELVDCLQQSKFPYLKKEYLDCQKLVENNIQIKYNEAIDSITKSNQQNVIIMDENFEKLNLLLEYLTIIDQHKQIIFTEFSITKDLLEKTIIEKCHEIKQCAINNLTSDFGNCLLEVQQSCISNSTNISVEFEKTKQNMQNLLNMSKQIKEIKEINDIFNECKKQVLDVHKIYYQELEDKLKELFQNREQSNDKKESEIEQMSYQFVKLQNSERYLSSFFKQQDKFHFYKIITEKAGIFIKHNLDYIQKFTRRYHSRLFISENQCSNDKISFVQTNQNSSQSNELGILKEKDQHIDNQENLNMNIQNSFIGEDYKRLPKYEMQIFKLLDSNQKFKLHLNEFEKDYSSSRNILQQFLQKAYESLRENCSSKRKSKYIEKEIHTLDSIRKIDIKLKENIEPSYSAFQTNLIEGINQNWNNIKNNLKKYKVTDENELKDEDILENSFIRDVHKIYKYYLNLQWADIYLQQSTVSSKIKKIQQSLKNYQGFLLKKSFSFVKNNKFDKLNTFLKKIDYLQAAKEDISENNEVNGINFNQINDAITDEIQTIENQFKEQENSFQDILQYDLDLRKLNNGLVQLSQIKKLHDFPQYNTKYNTKAKKLIEDIKQLTIKYFNKNYKFIYDNQEIDRIESLIKHGSLKKQIDFISKIKDINSNYHEINNCLEDQQNQMTDIFDIIDNIYEKLIEDYDININSQNLNERIKKFNIITKYCYEFKNYFETIYKKQQNKPNPNQIVNESIQNIISQIKNQQYDEILTYMLSLQNVKQAENDVVKGLQTLYNKIQKNLFDLENIIKDFLSHEYYHMTFEKFQNQFKKLIEQIKEISTIFEQLNKQDEFTKIQKQKEEFQKFVTDIINHQIIIILEYAGIQNFTKMEQKFKTLELLLIVIRKDDYFISYHINWKQKLSQPIEDMYKNVDFDFKQNVEFFNRLKKMLENDASQFHQMYVNMKDGTEKRIKSFLTKEIEQINISIQSDELSKAKKELELYKQKKSELENIQIYFDEKNQIQDIDDQFTNAIKDKSGQLEMSIQNNNYQESIKLLKVLHKNDHTIFNKKILILQDQMKKNIESIEKDNIKLSSEEITSKLKKINFIQEVLKEFPITHNLDILEELKQNIFQKILTKLEDLERFLRSDKDITSELQIVDLFKIQNFLKLFQESDNKAQDIQFHDLNKKINELKKCLEDTLNSLIQNQTELKNQINSKKIIKNLNSFYTRVILITKKFDQFKQYLVKDNQKEIDEKYHQLLGKILYSHELDIGINNQFDFYENQIEQAWNKSDYTTVKNTILSLNQISTFNDAYQVKINNIIQNYSNLKDEMTKKALQYIKEEKYDKQLNQLINNIYSAEETLNDIDQFGYSAQSQINLINDQIAKQMQDIITENQQSFQGDPIKISEQILIQLQKIADKISRFSSTIKKKQESYLENFLKNHQQAGVISLGQILNETTEGRYIVNGMKIFESLVVESFNKRAAMHDLPYILDNILVSEKQKEIKKLDGDQLSCLKEYYQIYESTYKQQLNKYVLKNYKVEIVEIVNSIFTTNKISIENWNDSTKKLIATALGNICAYWTLEKSAQLTSNQNQKSWYTPTQTQILSVMMLLGLDCKQNIFQKGGNVFKVFTPFQNKIIEILTGEGKSLALAFCSILFAKIGCCVDVVCYSKYLSSRDNNDFSKFFENFGVRERIMYGNFGELVEKYIKINGDLRDLTQKAINNQFNNHQQQNSNLKNLPKILLIDEVDVFFDTNFYGKTYNPIIWKSSPEIKNIIREIWKMKTEKQMGNPKQIKDSIMKSNDYNQLVNYYPQIKQYIERQISLLSEAVQSFENHKYEYIVKNDKIGYKQLDNSYCFNTSYGYTTLFTYFKLLGSKISQQALDNYLALDVHCGNLSYALIPNIYQNILGVTGTLKSLNSSMKDIIKQYKIKKEIYTPSMYGKSNRDFNDKEYVIVEDNINEQFLKIREIAQLYYNKQQAVLIFFKNKNEIDEFLKSQNQIIPHDQYNKIIEDTNDISNQVKSATQKKAISLCVREYGRGMDFVCHDDDIENNGGVVVIQTFLSEDKTEEIQIQGRTARQGKKGKYYLILNEQELTTKFKVNSQQINFWKKDQSNKTLYQNLADLRDNLWNQTFQVKSKQVTESNEKHNETLQYQQDLQNGDRAKIFQFINKNG